MMSLGILASAQQTKKTPDVPGSHEEIKLIQTRRTNAGANENTFFTGVSTSGGTTIVLVAAIKDYGPTIYEATDIMANPYEEVIRFRDPTTSAAAAIFVCYDAEPVPSTGFISFAATYDDPAGGYPLPTGVSVLEMFEFSGVGELADVQTYFNNITPVAPPQTDAKSGDLVIANLAAGVTSRVWTPTNPDYTNQDPYRAGNLTSHNSWDVRDVDGMTSPQWTRSGSNANTSVIMARFSPKPL